MFAKEKVRRRCLNPTNSVTAVINERTIRDALIIIAFVALTVGLADAFSGRNGLAQWIWAVGNNSYGRGSCDLIDAVAFISMATALEDFAIGRAERDLKSLGDCAPRAAHHNGLNV
jgi:cation transport ATPase